MQYTKQQFVQKIKQTYPQYQSVDDDELFDKMIARYPQYQNQVIQGDGDSGVVDFAQGVAKSAGSTVLGLGTLGRKAQEVISKGGDAVFGKYNPLKMGERNTIFDTGSAANLVAQEKVKADTKGEKIGKFVGDVAQFAIPGSYAAKATAGMSMATRAATQGLVGAGMQAAKTGDIGKDELVVGAASALMVPVGDVAIKGLQSLSTHLPEWLVRPLLKQAPGPKLKGKDAAKYLVESGNIGSVDNLIQKSDDAMGTLNSQIDDLLAQGTGKGVTISRDQLVTDIVSKINQAGGAIDETQLLSTIDNLAPQARGLLNKPTLTLQEANQLRKLLDGTLGDRAFFAKELTFNKEILMNFTNALRESVKSSDDALRPLYEEFAKNITIKNALLSRATAGGGANSVGMYDLLTGGAAFTATGNPLLGILAAGGRRALESAPVKTALAQVFKNTDKLIPVLEAMSPASRAVVLELISSLSEDEPASPNTPGQSRPTSSLR
jgi:hypothetical protein